jgi:small subunit ribosomal protein S6
MINYELMFVINSNISEEDTKSIVDQVKSSLESAEAEIISESNFGKRKLAYVIRGQQDGNYFIFKIAAPGSAVVAINKKLRMNSNVLRHILIKESEL